MNFDDFEGPAAADPIREREREAIFDSAFEATAETKIEVGTRVYNRGDMANPEHFGTVIANDGRNVTIESDEKVVDLYPEGITRLPPDAVYVYTVPVSMVTDYDLGNGMTRIVTEAAYKARREAAMASFREKVARVDAKYPLLDRDLEGDGGDA